MASHPSNIVRMDLTTLQESENSYSLDFVEYNIASAHSSTMTKLRIKCIFIGSYVDTPLLCPFSTLKIFLSKTEHLRTTPK
jgi:hypothetical protein